MWRATLPWLAVAACGGEPSTLPDAADANDAAILDDAAPDAPGDAGEPDASTEAAIDAAIDATPLTCIETTELVLDVAPLRIWTSAALGSTLYVSTYPPGDPAAGGEIVAIAMPDLAATSIATTAGRGVVRSIAGWLYVAEGAQPGSVWRYRPGQAIETLASGRDGPSGVIADDTHAFWIEGTASGRAIVRAPLGGGAVVPVATLSAVQLAVDDQRLYAGELAGPIRGYRKDSWFNNWSSGSVLLNVGMLIDDGAIVVVGDHGVFSVRPPATDLVPIATVPNLQPHHGITLQDGFVWVTAGTAGLRRAPRAGGAFEQVTPSYAHGDPVFVDGYLTWTGDDRVYRCRP